jgi:hypothetical protein
MRHAPWLRKNLWGISPAFQVRELFRAPKFRLAAGITITVLVTIFGLLSSFSFEAVAQNFLRLVRPAASDQIAIPVQLPWPDDSNSYSTPGYFSLSIAQAQEQINFPVKVIDHSISYLTFDGAHFDADTGAIIQRYTHPVYTLYLSQRRLDGIEEYSLIGGSAPIETVLVHGIDAEFVTGGWRLDPANSSLTPTDATGTQTSVQAYWDANIPQKLMRWQEENYLLEILVIEANNLEKTDLIRIAESVK